MLALRFDGPLSWSLAEVDQPAAGAGEVLVAPHYVGLCGTDLELFNGSMPYFSEGVAVYPIQPGHEVSGVVVESRVESLAPGTAVLIDPVVGCGVCAYCRLGQATRCKDRRELGLRGSMPGGASELIAVPIPNIYPIPAGVSLRDAVLVEPGVTALNAVERLQVVAGVRALVVGAGTVGLIAAQILKARGAAVDVLVVERAREELPKRLGVSVVREVDKAEYAVVIEAAGTPTAVKWAFSAVEPGGKVAIAGVQPGPIDHFDLNEIVLKDITVIGVLNGPGLYERMLQQLADGFVAAGPLIDAVFPLSEAGAALARLTDPSRVAPKVLLRVNS